MIQSTEPTARAAKIEVEPADLAVVSLLSGLFSDAGDDLPTVVRFVQGRVFPAQDSITLDIGPRLCRKAIARVASPNVSTDDVEDRLADRGEIDTVATGYDFDGQRDLAAFSSGGQDGLTVAEVNSELRALTVASGSDSEEMKLKTPHDLFNRIGPDGVRFLVQFALSEMRIDVSERIIRDAVAGAFLITPADATAIRDDDTDAEAEAAVRGRRSEAIAAVVRALQVSNDYGMVVELARGEGEARLDGVHLETGRPM